MFEELDKYDLVECPADGCEYFAPVAHVVPHILGRSDPEHNRVESEENLQADQF
jgi:hypothetical protein